MTVPFRIGHGYDVHRFCIGRELVLGGVKIPHTEGLLGHSDADCLLHAVMDAVLGAIGERDIGYHFPDSEESYRGIDSRDLCRRVAALVAARFAAVVNIDATVIAERPKLSPYLPAMCDCIRELFGGCAVNIKATTEEGLGFTGRGEGVACHAVCLVALSAEQPG